MSKPHNSSNRTTRGRENVDRNGQSFGAFAGNSRVGQMLPAENGTPSQLLEQLQAVQSQHGCITRQQIADAALDASIPLAEAHGVASFYSMLKLSDATEIAQPAGKEETGKHVVHVCDGPACNLRGACQILTQLNDVAAQRDDLKIERTSCLGQCDVAPAAMIDGVAAGPILASDELADIPADVTLGDAIERLLARKPWSGAFQANAESHPLTAEWGVFQVVPLEKRYGALTTALGMPPTQIVETVENADLRGRGGAGFNTGRKWKMVAETAASQRYVVCNADESEPGVFKDRVCMEHDPHRLLEGMAICGNAVGASIGIIYIRGEYAECANVLNRSILEARNAGHLGKGIHGSSFDFDVHIHRGAGAYICGEETALLESLEGRRGEPRARPPFPTTNGYHGLPTVVNNVETLCWIPYILANGADAYRALGVGESAGTKLYCLSGHVERPGVYELPLGTTLREVLACGGDMSTGNPFKFALTGGAAGTFVSPAQLDTPLDYNSHRAGVALGSGAVMVADSTINVVSMLHWVLQFFEHESCGKCTPCRVGTRLAREIVARIEQGSGATGDIDGLRQLARHLEQMSFCGLGQSVAWPIESAIERFTEDFANLGASSCLG